MIYKNIHTGGELERFKQATGAIGRFRLRGPRRNPGEYQDCAAIMATHGTLYTANSYIRTENQYQPAPAYALTGWCGAKPIISK